MVKKNLGRRKVEMKKMTNESHLKVTFSRRRAGLFKKASELGILCGAELALVVFSPSKKVYSFGHPSVDTVIDRYFGRNTPDTSGTSLLVEAHGNANIRELCMHIDQVTRQLEAEKERGEELDEMKEANRRQYRWQSPIEELDLSQLLQLKSAVEELKKKVEAEKLSILNANPQQFYIGNSSGSMAFGANTMDGDGGYCIPDRMVPVPGYNPSAAQGYSIANRMVPTPGYNPGPAQGYSIPNSMNPADEYHVNLEQGYTINPADGYNANSQENDFLDLLGFGSQEFGGEFF